MEEERSSNSKSSGGCCGWVRREWKKGYFGGTDDEKTLDLVQTFCPRPIWLSAILKLSLFGWTVSFIVDDFIGYHPPGFWFAYLSHWGIIAAVLYQMFSFVSCILLLRERETQPANVNLCALLATWVLFSCAVMVEIIIAILFWTLDYDGGRTSYAQLFRHGVLCVAILFDGIAWNRMPIYLKQIVFPYLYLVLWIVWSLIHAFSGIGNPRESDRKPTTMPSMELSTGSNGLLLLS